MSNEMISVPRSMLVDMAHNQHKKVAAYMPLIAPLLAKPAEQHQGEPVELPQRDESLGTSERDDYANGYRHGWNAYQEAVAELGPLYTSPAEQSAPVAVVLPEPRQIRGENDAHRVWHSQGWNACLDEIARLNPPQQ